MACNQKFKISSFLIVGLSFFLFSCYYRFGGTGSELSPENVIIPQSKLDSVSYKSVYERVIRTNCLSCHDSGKFTLTSYVQLSANIDKIYTAVFKEMTMPKRPNPPLDHDQYITLLAWIRSGGPEFPINGKGEPGIEPPPPLGPTYKSLKVNIFDLKCLPCHSLGGEATRIPLVTKKDFTDSSLVIIDPDNPEESGLLVVLDRKFESKKFMPPPKSGYTSVTDEQLNVIRDWIYNRTPD